MKIFTYIPAAAIVLMAATPVAAADEWVAGTDYDAVVTEMKASFSEKNGAGLDRIDQSDMQKICSATQMEGKQLTKEQFDQIASTARDSIKFPADGQFLGDWKAGEKVAQSGRGLQTSDKPGAAAGGNCYACHQMTKAEISFGNIGTPLLHYGKLRGNSKEIMEYAWTRIYNSHAYVPCTVMPRFGDAGILTEAQMKDVMALLFDPASPVNDDTVTP